MSSPYAADKVQFFQDRLQDLRDGRQPPPLHVEIILSDLCNQNCGFCLVEGTQVDTPYGKMAIEDLRVSDRIIAPDGTTPTITEVSDRWVDEVYEIQSGDRVVYATGEHPFLRQDGWTLVKDLRVGDTVAQKGQKASQLRREVTATAVHSGVSQRSALPVRLRTTGPSLLSEAGFSAPLEGLLARSSTDRQITHVQAGQSEESSENADQESNERSRHCGEGLCRVARGPASEVEGRKGEHCGCRQAANVVGSESDEGSRNPSKGYGEDSESGALQERDPFSRLGDDPRFTTRTRFRDGVDRTGDARLSRHLPEEMCRGLPECSLHREIGSSDGKNLRDRADSSDAREGLEVSGGLQEVPSIHHPGGIDPNPPRLRIAGIELERGLELRPITSIRRIQGRARVYNFSCPPVAAYIANDFVVHNCAYRMDGYTSNQLFHIIEADGSKNDNPNRMISYEKAIEIIDDCKAMGARAVQFTGGGEPTVHPKHREIFQHVRDLGLEWALVTNCMILRPEMPELLTSATWMRISLDAGTEASYSKIRETALGTYSRVLTNLGKIRQARDKAKSKLVIGAGYVVTKDNWQEIYDGVKNAKAAGADNIRISGIFQNEDDAYFKDFFEQARDEARRAVSDLSDDSFQVFNRFGERVDDLKQKNPDYEMCGHQHFTTYIGGDLNVYRCCVLAYNERGVIGSLKDQRFSDLWSSEEKKADFAGFDARGCERCMFNDKNRAILYQIENPPPHAAFV